MGEHEGRGVIRYQPPSMHEYSMISHTLCSPAAECRARRSLIASDALGASSSRDLRSTRPSSAVSYSSRFNAWPKRGGAVFRLDVLV